MTESNDGRTHKMTETNLQIKVGTCAENVVSPNSNSKANGNTQSIFVSALDLINHTLIVLVTAYIVYHATKTQQITAFNIHVILCTISYVLMMSEAILVLATGNFLTRRFSHRANKHLHWILQAIGLILNLVGIIMMYNVKRKHFRSIHAIMGLSSLVIVCVITVCGYPVWIAWKLRRFVRPVVVKLVHDFLGIAGFVLGMATQCYGYKKNWLYNVTQVEHISTIMLVLTALITILSLRGALVSIGRKVVDVLS